MIEIVELLSKRAIDLSGEELAEIVLYKLTPQIIRKRKILEGIDGIMEACQVGRNKAYEINRTGIIDEAIVRDGTKIFIDADLAAQLYYDYLKSIKRGFKPKS